MYLHQIEGSFAKKNVNKAESEYLNFFLINFYSFEIYCGFYRNGTANSNRSCSTMPIWLGNSASP